MISKTPLKGNRNLEVVKLHYTGVKAETEKSLRMCILGKGEVWIPKSIIVFRTKGTVTVHRRVYLKALEREKLRQNGVDLLPDLEDDE